jgi:hypothetical protein
MGGFLPNSNMIRNIAFGGSAFVFSTVAFFVSMNKRSLLVSI